MDKQQMLQIEVLHRLGVIKRRPVEVQAWLIYDRFENPYDTGLEDEINSEITRLRSNGICYGDLKGRQFLTSAGKAAVDLKSKRPTRRGQPERRK